MGFAHKRLFDTSDQIGWSRIAKKRNWSVNPKNDVEYHPSPVTPELRLVVAVLVRAMRDIANDATFADIYDAKNQRECKSEAREWVDSSSIEPWSFCWCCLSLGFDDHIIAMIRAAIPGIKHRDLDYLT